MNQDANPSELNFLALFFSLYEHNFIFNHLAKTLKPYERTSISSIPPERGESRKKKKTSNFLHHEICFGWRFFLFILSLLFVIVCQGLTGIEQKLHTEKSSKKQQQQQQQY